MNIFVVDKDPIKAARALCDQHIVKMPTESAQMLCTAHRILDGDKHGNLENYNLNKYLYKITHKNHPCSKWVREAYANYMWLYHHYVAMCNEYSERFGDKCEKIHGASIGKNADILDSSSYLIRILKTVPINIQLNKFQMTPFMLGFSESEFIVEDNPVQSYRNFYNSKDFDMRWKRNKPDWYSKYE